MGVLLFKHLPPSHLDQTEEAKKDKHTDISFPSQLFWCDRVIQLDVIIFISASIITGVALLARWEYSPLQSPTLVGL